MKRDEGGQSASSIPIIPALISTLSTEYVHTHPGRWPDRQKAEGRVGSVNSVFIPE